MTVTVTDPALLAQLAAAGTVVELTDPAGRSLGVLTRSDVADILAAAKAVGEHPLFEDHVRAVEEYRRLHNAAPDAE
jgi:hypothetical protein